MLVERMAYIINFQGKEVPKKLNSMDVNLVYVSKKANYAVVYVDKSRGEKMLVQNLLNTKGFQGVIPSLFFDENVNIE